MAEPKSEDLPPTQYLVLEVLAARARLGEVCWTFPTRLRAALDALASQGFIGWKYGTIERTCMAWLTDAGREFATSAGYVPPAESVIEWGARREEGHVRNYGPDGERVARDVATDLARTGVPHPLVYRRVMTETWREHPDA